MTAKQFLRSNGLYVLPLIQDQNSPEKYFPLTALLNEYAKQKAWEAWKHRAGLSEGTEMSSKFLEWWGATL